MNPDSAVEREAMSEEQTFRNEDHAFLPLRKASAVSAVRHYVEDMEAASQL